MWQDAGGRGRGGTGSRAAAEKGDFPRHGAGGPPAAARTLVSSRMAAADTRPLSRAGSASASRAAAAIWRHIARSGAASSSAAAPSCDRRRRCGRGEGSQRESSRLSASAASDQTASTGGTGLPRPGESSGSCPSRPFVQGRRQAPACARSSQSPQYPRRRPRQRCDGIWMLSSVRTRPTHLLLLPRRRRCCRLQAIFGEQKIQLVGPRLRGWFRSHGGRGRWAWPHPLAAHSPKGMCGGQAGSHVWVLRGPKALHMRAATLRPWVDQIKKGAPDARSI
jgi:hypothetical protein